MEYITLKRRSATFENQCLSSLKLSLFSEAKSFLTPLRDIDRTDLLHCTWKRCMSGDDRGILMLKRWMIANLFAGALFIASSAQATVAKALSFDELFKQSDLVVHGWVIDQWVDAPDGLPGMIYTHTIIEVASAFKGYADHQIELRQIGGQLGQHSVRLSGTPHFKLGSEVVVFAGRDNEKSPFVSVGLAQGVFHVDRKGANLTVFRDLSGITFHNPLFRAYSRGPMPDRLPSLVDEILDRWSDDLLKEGN